MRFGSVNRSLQRVVAVAAHEPTGGGALGKGTGGAEAEPLGVGLGQFTPDGRKAGACAKPGKGRCGAGSGNLLVLRDSDLAWPEGGGRPYTARLHVEILV